MRVRKRGVMVGVSDHGGWAVLVTADSEGTLLDRRRVELVDEGLPKIPHHHEGQKLPLKEAVALVARVRASAERNAMERLESLSLEVPQKIVGLALRICPPLPETVAERITNYRAMCVADWVMYRQALASAATERGWSVHWYDARKVLAASPRMKSPGRPWTKDHQLALAAAMNAFSALLD